MPIKVIALLFSIWLCFTAPAFADWQPTFNPSQHVYIDPALQQHPSAPIGFETELTQQLAAHTKTNYYVVAVESSQHPKGSLGVAKANDITAAWTGLKDFPVDDYALVVWARQQGDPAKGGFGKNVSANLQWAKTVDIKPLFKPYMPQNPRAAILAIVGGIDNAIVGQGVFLLLSKLGMGAAIILFAIFLISNKMTELRTRKDRASELYLKYKLAATSVSDRLAAIDTAEILPFYAQLYPDNEVIKVASLDLRDLDRLNAALGGLVSDAQAYIAADRYLEAIERFEIELRIALSEPGNDIGFTDAEQLLRSIEGRIANLSDRIAKIDAAKGNVQAPVKPAPAKTRPQTAPSRPASTPARPAPPRTVVNQTVYNDYSSTVIDNSSSSSSSSSSQSDWWGSSDSSSSSSSSSGSSWGSDGGDYGGSSDGGDY